MIAALSSKHQSLIIDQELLTEGARTEKLSTIHEPPSRCLMDLAVFARYRPLKTRHHISPYVTRFCLHYTRHPDYPVSREEWYH